LSLWADSLPVDLSPIVEALEAAYPDEGCGLILRGPGGFRFEAMDNAYDRLRAADPVAFPRTARTAYAFDPVQWLKALREADRRDETVACIYHSHCDSPAGFSAEDRLWAAPDGAPLMPGTLYLVLAIEQGRVAGIRVFGWAHGNFQEADFPVTLKAT